MWKNRPGCTKRWRLGWEMKGSFGVKLLQAGTKRDWNNNKDQVYVYILFCLLPAAGCFMSELAWAFRYLRLTIMQLPTTSVNCSERPPTSAPVPLLPNSASGYSSRRSWPGHHKVWSWNDSCGPEIKTCCPGMAFHIFLFHFKDF